VKGNEKQNNLMIFHVHELKQLVKGRGTGGWVILSCNLGNCRRK